MKVSEIQQQLASRNIRRLLLAVSGGLDSICLANYFIQNRQSLGIEWLGVAHVHHGLREISADLDANLVQDFAETNHLPLFLKKLDGKALKEKGSIEENARNARYEFLYSIAIQNNAVIATAHHAGDQAETLYMRLRRGVTLAGLRGIQTFREGSLESTKVTIYRPFLNTTREELMQYAKEHALTWRTDETNFDESFIRNKIRHRLLPHLEQLNPGATKQLYRLSELSNSAYDKILKSAQRLYQNAEVPSTNWPFLQNFYPFTKVMALDYHKLNGLTEGPKKELFRLWLDHKGFRFPTECPNLTANYQYHGRTIEKCRQLLWFFDKNTEKTNEISTDNLLNLYLNSENQPFLGQNGEIRYPAKGDIHVPLNQKAKPRPLNQWFTEQGVPREMRPFLPVYARENQVFWVWGVQQKRKNNE
ncbi:MAG: tRNA lysidine(34) synthetase TilS [Fibrobacteraceae bacterium]|nr:tRNA lysidine(34) synthetase TilS [Fibrobacteraceae bacterium]